MKKILLTLGMILVAASVMLAELPQHLSVTTPQGRTVTVTVLTDNIVKVTNTPAGVTRTAGGHTSVLDESNPGKRLNGNGKGAKTNICGMEISLTADGKAVINAGQGKTVTDEGLRDIKDGRQVLTLQLSGNGSFYGAGERGHKLNLRGDTLVMYNRQNYGYTGNDPRISQMNITMPLFVSSDGYAVVFDDFGAAEMILSDPVQYVTETKEPVSWYFVNGASSMADVMTSLTELTGRQELPPLWSLGYITSKYGYKTQAETEDTVDRLRQEGYPVDGVVLDLYWYGKEQDMGRLDWDPQQWPDPADMMDYLGQKGVHVVTISQPYILRNGRGLKNYNDLAAGNMLVMDSVKSGPQEVKIWVGEGGMFDVSNPNTCQWLANRYKVLSQKGVSGWWGDLGEPEVHPESGMHANGLTARQYHNLYGNDWSKIIYDMHKKEYPDTRLLTMMRGGTTGLQRYDVFPWSTDVSRSWGGLEPQVRIMLGSGLSGLGYMGHDVGGFAVDEKNPSDPELYVRWLQLGTFSPMLRTHAQQMAEPFNYPEQEAIIKPFIQERYRWLPYNYTLAWKNATKGWPLVRTLNFHAPAGSKTYDDISDQYLWGKDVMVAPVMTKGATSRRVVFPEGGLWFDLNDPTKTYKGGTVVENYPAPLEVLPMFVREGAFIPMATAAMKSTKMYNATKLTINYYPTNGVSEYTMFEDDMKTPSSKSNNAGRTLTFSGDATGKNLAINLAAKGEFPGAGGTRTINLIVYNQAKEPKSVLVDGRNTRFVYDKAKKTVTVNWVWNVFKPAVVMLNH